ncbi:MAG: NADH-quinone oxidoreductase subunit J [Deltaproteobacteria bacterium]|nr:NADH-quinone oxidoreductase subunit J [Deltaproteobacteria bacterium]
MTMDFSWFKWLMFIVAAALSIVGSLMMVTRRNAIHSALWMIATFIAIAVIYVMQNAQFIAIAQIMVYAGAIMMLILFVIMLVNLEKDSVPERKFSSRKFTGAVITIMLFFEILVIATAYQITGREAVYSASMLERTGNVRVMGSLLYGQYLFPFELASILLLIGIVGAVILAKRKKE